jgi:phosphate transport system substrate-binding protein
VSPAWAKAVGTGRSLKWPVGYAADGNPGVAAAIANQAGNYVRPTSAAIAADAAARPAITPDRFSIVNQPASGAYPICGYSWVLISARQPSTAAGQPLTALIRLSQAYAATLGYVPLPAAIQHLAAATLARATGPEGSPLTG